MAEINDPLALATALTTKTRQLCLGLESGAADILALVTPTTAAKRLARCRWTSRPSVTNRGLRP